MREALLAGASTQLRNMATIGGNLLQRTRCRYFRDPSVPACNKRTPGSGCAAITGPARMHAILGASEHCIALHASDLCVPLVALDAVVHAEGTDGQRTIPLTEFYRLPGDRPDLENVLAHGELITAIEIPLLPAGARSGLSEGARPRLLRVRAHVGGRGAPDRGRRDDRGARRARRGRDDPVARAAAEEVLIGAAPSTAVFRAGCRGRDRRSLHRSGDRVQGRARQADDRADAGDGGRMTTVHRSRCRPRRRPGQGARCRAPTRPTSPTRISRTRRSCAARSRPAG